MGADADLTLVDLDAAWTVDKDKLHSKSHNCPYHGQTLAGRVVLTIRDGRITYKA